MSFRSWLPVAFLVVVAQLPSEGGMIQVTQRFSPINHRFRVYDSNTQNLSYTTNLDLRIDILTDTTSPDLYHRGYYHGDSFGLFAADVFLTSHALGVENLRVTNGNYFWQNSSSFGWSEDLSIQPVPRIVTTFNGQQPDPNEILPLNNYDISLGSGYYTYWSQIHTGSHFSEWIELENGLHLGLSSTGYITGLGARTSAVEVSAMPEPSSFGLFALGGIGLAILVSRRRRTA